MSDFRIDKITNRDGSAGTQIAGISTFSGTSGMQLPVGPTEYRGGRGDRGVFGGGETPTRQNVMDYISMQSAGNAVDFGDLVNPASNVGGCGNATRGIWWGGEEPATLQSICYTTFASKGGASEFGDMQTSRKTQNSSTANSTRGIIFGGYGGSPAAYQDNIEFVTIATTGDSTDFGDTLTVTTSSAACASPTRGVMAGGDPSGVSPYYTNVIQFVEIATTGNSVDFGDLFNRGRHGFGGCSSPTRGVFMGGRVPTVDKADYITIATKGNALDFGDTVGSGSKVTSLSNGVRGFMGGSTNTICWIHIPTTADALDFGDLTVGRMSLSSCSDSSGSLGEQN